MRESFTPPDDALHRERCRRGTQVRERLLEYQRQRQVAPRLTRRETLALGELSAVTSGIPRLMREWRAHDEWLDDDETQYLIRSQKIIKLMEDEP